ncbi:T9SS type A sorting domain-containing protein [Yeosuana sp.]|uniref:T9SS type A sorting domain-containing protein n=1 Tax=Yeosuana sp. TaxID=2529388 RepID=UPI0040552EEF
MKKTKFFLILFVFLITYYSGNAQITAQINNVKVNGTQISNCGTIAFGANNSVSLSLTLKIIKPSTTNVGDFATFKLYTKYDSNSDPIFIDGIIVPNNAFTQGTSWEAEFSQTTLQASSIASSGSVFYGEYEISGNLKYKTCNYALTKPVFTLSSNTNSIPCGSLSPITFTVNNINSSPGTLSYNWVIGTGWNYNGITAPTNLTTSSNTLTLVPTMYPPSNISVIPILSSVAQPQKVVTLSLAPFTTTSATINGNTSICEPSTTSVYSIANLPSGLTVTWSSSNTAIATVNSTTGTSTTVNKVSNGTFNLIARVTNSCGQFVDIPQSIRIGGLPNFTINAIPNYGAHDLYLQNEPITEDQGITSVTWTKISGNGQAGGSGLIGYTDGSPTSTWTVTVRITATNECGSTSITKTYTGGGYGDPCRKVSIIKDKNKKNNFIAKAPACRIGDSTIEKTQEIINIKVYNISGNFIKEFKTDSFDLSNVKKGIYIVNITTTDDVFSSKILVD